MLTLLAAATWFGPVSVTMPIAFTGNPYDPEENDIRVEFVGTNGVKESRLAYFVGEGKFAATLATKSGGSYKANFYRNGKLVATAPDSVKIDTALPHGYIGISGSRFSWTDGTPYFPVGYNYAWRGVPNETVAQGLTKMGANGANWARIWACHWDGKNPFFPADKATKLKGRELQQEPLQMWDGVIAAAEKADVEFQFVLFHHGPYSTTTDSNWRDHPWNKANGGFLADPTDFFIDPEAKRRSKIWIRYATARYGHSPAIMCWELFNEVQWVDAIKKNPTRVGDVAAWHKEMGNYIRSLDPYHHLVTSSSNEAGGTAAVFETMDYEQPHTYPSNVLAAIGGTTFKGKLGFFGEFGPPAGPESTYRPHVRDGLYGGMLAGHAGAGQFWFWDQVDRRGLLADYAIARKVIDESGLLGHTQAVPVALSVETPRVGDLVLAPGAGWAKSQTTSIALPLSDLKKLGGWSPYFQSLTGNNKGWASPFTLTFNAKAPGKITFGIGQISTGGGTLRVFVNGTQASDKKWDAGARGRETVSVDYPAGPVTIRLENHGQDWVQLNSITVPGQAPTALAHGMSDGKWALLRIVGSDASHVQVKGLNLADGTYKVRVFDLLKGGTRDTTMLVEGGSFSAKWLPNECVLALSK